MGTRNLAASAADDYYEITHVEVRITGNELNETVGPVFPAYYVWVARWDTTKVPDGTYTLRFTAYDAGGNSGHSVGVAVSVKNHS